MRGICAVFILSSVLAAASLSAAETAAPPLTLPETAAPAPASVKSGATDPVAAKRFRVGYVDILQVAEQSAAGKHAKADFDAKADRLKTQIATKQKHLEKQKATLETKLPTYAPEQRAAKIKEYEKKVDELRKLLQKADSEMKPMQEKLLREIYGKIEKAAGEYGAAQGFDAIIEKRELLYLGKNVDAEDLTEILIKELNKE